MKGVYLTVINPIESNSPTRNREGDSEVITKEARFV